jgi:large subunit ribosomal protein L10
VQGLRRKLAQQGAEYHVVKNNLLTVALRQLGRPDMRAHLEGHTALVVGGKEPFEVAKAVFNFSKDTKKAAVKVGVMGAEVLPAEQVERIAQLPSFPALRAQLLGTLLAAPQSLLYLMKARSEQAAAA